MGGSPPLCPPRPSPSREGGLWNADGDSYTHIAVFYIVEDAETKVHGINNKSVFVLIHIYISLRRCLFESYTQCTRHGWKIVETPGGDFRLVFVQLKA